MRALTRPGLDRLGWACDYQGVTTSREIFAFAAKAAATLSPPPRGAATSATFRQIASLPVFDDGAYPLTSADLGLALVVIWAHYAAEHPTLSEDVAAQRKARAKTLREIGEASAPWLPAGWTASLEAARAAWSAVAETFPGDDDRARAIRETWAREAAYLTA